MKYSFILCKEFNFVNMPTCSRYLFCILFLATHILQGFSTFGGRNSSWLTTTLCVSIPVLDNSWTSLSVSYMDRNSAMATHTNVVISYKNDRICFFQPLSVHGWTSAFLTGCVTPWRRDWAIFCHVGPGRVGRVRSAREKFLKILCQGQLCQLNPGPGEYRQWDTFILPLSYHDLVHEKNSEITQW